MSEKFKLCVLNELNMRVEVSNFYYLVGNFNFFFLGFKVIIMF